MAERGVIHRAICVATEDTFTSLRPERYASMTDIQIGLQIFETLVGYERSLSWLELFKSQLARVETRCVVHKLPFAALRRALQHGSFEAARIGSPGFVDPDRVLFEIFHSGVEPITRA